MTRPNPPRSSISRRTLITGSAALGAAAGAGLWTPATAHAAAPRAAASELSTDPFTLGVASGDPSSDGIVLWTRLATDPLAEDGLGGMPNQTLEVEWQLATDEGMAKIAASGITPAAPDAAHSVHVEVDKLEPHRHYWYRFRVGTYVSPVGRTRTAPAPDVVVDSLRMAFVSCSQYEHGYFDAYRALAEDDPDLVLHLGDYQYEYTAGDYTIPGGNIRDHEGPETVTLANYRQRHAQYKSDADLQAAHAAAPFLVVFDDHEVDNNWADEMPENPAEKPTFMERRTAAFKAYYENMPLRRSSIPNGPNIQIYRRAQWGRLASFHMLDTRQFRDDQSCGDRWQNDCQEAFDPKRTITGGQQEKWLVDGFRKSRARWDFLGQQVFFAQRDADAGPVRRASMDSWDGYVASRDRITRGWVDAKVRNPIVLTGDVHAHWASELKLDYEDPTSRTVGTELVCSSITSGGNGEDSDPKDNPFLEINPHLKFYNNLRGYVRTTITPGQMTADFRCLPYVHEQGAPVFTRATFVAEDGQPGLHQTADNPLPTPRQQRSDKEIINRTIRWESDRPK
ncbi:MAG: alkaline phosphatase [Streptosporangiales bacterium]|nr:alkaline phosphatase [Streptosporangiales bacterium]